MRRYTPVRTTTTTTHRTAPTCTTGQAPTPNPPPPSLKTKSGQTWCWPNYQEREERMKIVAVGKKERNFVALSPPPPPFAVFFFLGLCPHLTRTKHEHTEETLFVLSREFLFLSRCCFFLPFVIFLFVPFVFFFCRWTRMWEDLGRDVFDAPDFQHGSRQTTSQRVDDYA